MPQTQGPRLSYEDAVHVVWDDSVDHLREVVLALFSEFALELGIGIEVILDGALRPPRHEDQFRYPGRDGRLDGILDDGLVDDRQEFLRHRLGCGKEARAETSDGEDGFSDAGHGEA